MQTDDSFHMNTAVFLISTRQYHYEKSCSIINHIHKEIKRITTCSRFTNIAEDLLFSSDVLVLANLPNRYSALC